MEKQSFKRGRDSISPSVSRQKMKILVILSVAFCLVSGSIYPDGETKEQWDARINAKIEKRHMRDVTVKIPLAKSKWGQNLKLRVKQTAQSFPMGKP